MHRDYDDTTRDSETDTDDNESNGEKLILKRKNLHRETQNISVFLKQVVMQNM